MRHALFTTATRPLRPPILGDHYADLSDRWREAADPEAEYGETCTGIFDTGHGGFVDLVGLRVDGDGEPQYHDREYAIRVLGYEGVIEAERWLEERLADGLGRFFA